MSAIALFHVQNAVISSQRSLLHLDVEVEVEIKSLVRARTTSFSPRLPRPMPEVCQSANLFLDGIDRLREIGTGDA
jgi:hypothetical protein